MSDINWMYVVDQALIYFIFIAGFTMVFTSYEIQHSHIFALLLVMFANIINSNNESTN